MDFSNLRINCNRLGLIFAKNSDCITPGEEKRLQDLLLKEKLGKLTETQLDRIEVLQEKKDASEPHIVSRGAQTYLLYVYTLKRYGKPEKLIIEGDINPAAANGILKEPFVIDLVYRISGIKLYRNKKTLRNEYLHGVVDAWDSEDWESSKLVHEVKTTSDACKFFLRKRYPLSKAQYLQAQGYLALSDRDTANVHFCLVDHHESVIAEQRQLLFNYLCPDGCETARFAEEWSKKEGKLRFKHIPDKDRIFTCPVARNDEVIDKIYKKVKDCRKWLNDFSDFNENRPDHHFVDQNKIRL